MQIKISSALFLILSCYLACATADEANYFGINYKYRYMRGDNTASYEMRQTLPSAYNGGEVYYAHRFKNDVGLSFGYEQSKIEKQIYAFTQNQIFITDKQNAGDVSVLSNRIQAGQFDLVGYITVFKDIEAIGQIGFSIMRADMNGTVQTSGVTTNIAPSRSYGFVPRVGLGLQYFFGNDRFGIRAMLDWEETGLYRLKVTDYDGVRRTIRPFDESWCGTAGLVIKF
jgi:hypothetical protein